MAQSLRRGSVVVVTGASAGLGRSIAMMLCARGARVGLLARGRDGLEATRRDVEAAGGAALAIATDVARPDEVEAAARTVEDTLGPIDVWVNNAMASVFSPVKRTTPEEFRRVTEVTYLGCVNGTPAALTRMMARDRGVIVQVGSALAFRAIPLQAAYCAAKHAIQGFTEALRSELLHDRSRVRVVSVHMPALNTPHFGWVKTRLPREPQPVPPIFQPEVGAEAVLWAIEHDEAEMWVGWPTVRAIIANRIAPRLLDRYLARTAYEAQQWNGPVDRSRRDNLWEPVPGDRGARGAFSARAHAQSRQFWLRRHRGALGLTVVGLAASLAALVLGRHGARPPARARRRAA